MSNVLRENYSKVSLDDALLIQIIMIMVVVVLMYVQSKSDSSAKQDQDDDDEALPTVAWASTGNLLASTRTTGNNCPKIAWISKSDGREHLT